MRSTSTGAELRDPVRRGSRVLENKVPEWLGQLVAQLAQLRRHLPQPTPEEIRAWRHFVRSLRPPLHEKIRHAEVQWQRWREQVEQGLGSCWRNDPDMVRLDQHWRDDIARLQAELTYYRREQAPKPIAKPKHAGGKGP